MMPKHFLQNSKCLVESKTSSLGLFVGQENLTLYCLRTFDFILTNYYLIIQSIL